MEETSELERKERERSVLFEEAARIVQAAEAQPRAAIEEERLEFLDHQISASESRRPSWSAADHRTGPASHNRFL